MTTVCASVRTAVLQVESIDLEDKGYQDYNVVQIKILLKMSARISINMLLTLYTQYVCLFVWLNHINILDQHMQAI